MSKEANKQRKLLVKKLKERGVSVTNPLFEHAIRFDRVAVENSWKKKIHHRSCMKKAYSGSRKGYSKSDGGTYSSKVIIKHIPVTLSIAELSKATGMFNGEGGTKRSDATNRVADEFAKTHVAENRKTASRFSHYYITVGKGWTKGGQGRKPKKPVDEQPS